MADYAKELQRAHEQTKKQQEDLKKKTEVAAKQPADKEPSKEVNNVDDAYKGAPRNHDIATRNNNGQRRQFSQPRGGGDRGRGYRGRGMRGRGRDGDQGGEYQQRGGRRSFYRNNADGDEGVNDLDNAGGEGYGYRGQNRGRGYRGGPRGGPRGGTGPRGGRGAHRGGRRSYPNDYYNEVEYQSAEEQEAESSDEMLTQEQFEFIEQKIEQNIDILKGIVDAGAIEKKCREVEFDDKKFKDWVNSLIVVDQRSLADLEWNQTVTKEQKHADRAQTLHKAKMKAIRKERQEQQRIQREKRDAEKAKARQEKEARFAEKAAAKQKDQENADEEQEYGEELENGEVVEKVEDEGTTAAPEEDANEGETAVASEQKAEKPAKESKKKDKAKDKGSKKQYKPKEGQTMQYQAKSKPAPKKEQEVQEAPKEEPMAADDEYGGEHQDDYYDQEEEGMNFKVDEEVGAGENEAAENGDHDGEYVRKQSEDDDTELLAQTTQQHQKDEQERKRKQKEQEEAEKAAILRHEEEERRRQLDHKKKLDSEAAAAAELKRKQEEEEHERLQKEKEEAEKKKKEKEEEEKRLAAQKKQEEEASTTAQQSSTAQNQGNQFMFNPMLTAGMSQNPMMMGMTPNAFTLDKDTDQTQLEQQKQFLQQNMHFHQQLFLQYQAAYMQLVMQQQLLQTGGQSSPSKNSNQFSGQKPPVDMPMMPPNTAAMMGMMPGGMPNMPGAQNMGAGLGQDQQQFMQFQPFPMMMYQGAGSPMNFGQNFPNKTEEK